MPITLGHKIAGLKAQRELNNGTAALSKVFERLSSGMRINRASDDAAGLSLAASLNADVRVYGQAIRNINDGLSVASVAEGALHALKDITQRQLELAEQAANGTLTLAQRQALNTEANALVEEFNRVVSTTTYNGMNLFDPDRGAINIQAGKGNLGILSLGLSADLLRVIGDGTFGAASTYQTGTLPLAPLVGDVNGDGVQDLVVGDYSNGISIMLGNGDGSFAAGISLDIAGPSYNVYNGVLGDVNGDGNIDIVTANYNGGTLSILLGNGNGTFAAEVTIQSTGVSHSAVQLADINGDGVVDLVATEGETPGKITVLVGNGNGTFLAGVSYSVSVAAVNPRDLRIGDVNGDGRDDVVVVNYGSGTSSNVSVLLGLGDGTFGTAATFQLGGNLATGLQLADIDGDGRLDVITADRQTNNISILFGNGNGTFSAAITYQTSGGPQSILIGDYNGDGYLDIGAVDYTSNAISILIANGDGTFKVRSTYATDGLTPFRGALGDFNGDGVSDIVVANAFSDSVAVLLGNSDQTATEQHFNINTQEGALSAIEDLNDTLDRIVDQLGTIGAATSRMNVALNNLQSTTMNYTAALDRIMSADVASDVAEMIRRQVLQQAASAVLAHAMDDSSVVLALLR